MNGGTLKRGLRLVVASHNSGKVREIRELLKPFGVETVSAGELDLSEPEETGESFSANAELKAVAAALAAGLPALADDSGLEVAGLDGAPGIYSARWAGPDKDFSVAMARVARELDGAGVTDAGATNAGATDNDPRRANFTCALALGQPDGGVQLFEGKVFGQIVWPPRGTKGFGYDPIFVPDGFNETFGEMEPDQKHAISHRARAFEAFVNACLAASGR
ncbi:non-canonical purine NTP pyrophosphatase [bacterium MnTg02]|nr:non-canonical purine NTP pyrophosphatase [bacterium MnTg02]